MNKKVFEFVIKHRIREFNLVGADLKFLCKEVYDCKAYVWDSLQRIINNKSHPVNSLFISFKNDTNHSGALERIHQAEEILGFEKTEIFLARDKALVAKPADLRWFACVELFSLYLCAIRYFNYADTHGYDQFIENPKPLLDHIETLSEDFTENWAFKPQGIYDGIQGYQSIHTEGIYNFYKRGTPYDAGNYKRAKKIGETARGQGVVQAA